VLAVPLQTGHRSIGVIGDGEAVLKSFQQTSLLAKLGIQVSVVRPLPTVALVELPFGRVFGTTADRGSPTTSGTTESVLYHRRRSRPNLSLSLILIPIQKLSHQSSTAISTSTQQR
jgi:hypothetical protein